MRSFSLSELEHALGGRLCGVDTSFDAVSTDTRALQSGDLFVALRGPNFDGHTFVKSAAGRGASAALVSVAGDYPVSTLCVADTRQALGQLAALNRRHFHGKLVAITGSSGKTTVKNMLATILQTQAPTLATMGNLNNEIGLPLSLLRLQEQHEFAVIEMGASRAGDIRYLCGLAQPDVSMLLNAMPAHLDGFGDVSGVATAKGEIFTGLDAGGTAIINADSEFAPLWRHLAQGRHKIEFGLTGHAAVSARDIVDRGVLGSRFQLLAEQGELGVELALAGRHNVVNALAATAAALVLGVSLPDIGRALARVQAQPGRMHVTTLASGAVLVDDSYNANPGSVRAALDMLARCDGRRILVLGAMAELGADSEQLHHDIGRDALQLGIEELWLTGTETLATARGYGAGAEYCADIEELIRRLRGRFSEGDVVLVKGSRSAGTDAVVAALSTQAGGGH
jgi:UDP-N-acetylmuramoyl-tripeptide--D-alanyl-D-alanine ligase